MTATKGRSLAFHLLVATETEGTPNLQGGNLPVERNPNFNIGRNVRSEAYAPISISSFTTFNTFIEIERIMDMFSYSSSHQVCVHPSLFIKIFVPHNR